jgi:aspartate racemase
MPQHIGIVAYSAAISWRSFEPWRAKGCDAVVVGCTEIPLLVTPESSPLPTLDSTRLLAKAAVRKAVT